MRLPKAQKLPSGAYRCQVMVDGKRVSVVDDDPNKVQAKAIALKTGLQEREEKISGGSITLYDAITMYIDSRRNVLSPATIRGYKVIQNNRFHQLMKMKIRTINKAELQAAINADALSCSYKTLKNSIGLVVSVVSEYKEINTRGLKYPQHVNKEHPYLDTQQIIELINACRDNIAEVPILLAVWLGLRRSEIMGLMWESIDFKNKRIKIEHSLVPNEDGEFVQKDQLKNASSRRVLSCPEYIMLKLERYEPDPQKRIGRVFTMDPSVIYNNLKKICVKNNIPFVGVHGLRHTNASIMLSLGIVDKAAMKRGGWATDNTMKSIYQHVFASDLNDAESAIDAYFESMVEKLS